MGEQGDVFLQRKLNVLWNCPHFYAMLFLKMKKNANASGCYLFLAEVMPCE